jgi:hypothetical protein
MLINLQTLTREERIYELLKTQTNKSNGFNQFKPSSAKFIQNPDVTNYELLDLFSKIESRTYYISEAPNFEFNGSSHHTNTMKFTNVDDIVKDMNSNPDKYFIYYSIFKSPLTQPNNHRDLMLRGKFIEDPAYIRNQKIDRILN